MQRRSLSAAWLVAITTLVVVCGRAPAQQQGSVMTQVLGRLDSRRVAEGASFFVKTTSVWKLGPCGLPGGATLEGRVTSVKWKGSGVKREEMALRFLPIPCSGDETQELIPILVAMQGPHSDPREEFIAQQELVNALSSAVRRVAKASGSADGSGAGASSPGPVASGSAGHLGNYSPGASVERPLRIAEVLGMPGVKLSLPTLATDPTALSSSSQILIDPKSRFLLVIQATPRGPLQPPTVAGAAASIPPAKPVAPAVRENIEIEQCVETGCAFANNPATLVDSQLERRMTLRALGFKVRNNRVLRALAEDATVRFLGEDQLLITFDVHPLVTRSQEEAERFHSPRMIRALLFSITTGQVIRAEDWRVPDDGTYLWSLDGGHVLAHVGGDLVLYGPGLLVERKWSPLGDVRFLRVAPSRHRIAAAVTHERHTPEQHRRLADFLGPTEPVEEDLDFTVLDGQLNVESTRRLEHSPPSSEMLDTGLVVTEPGLRQSWIVNETTWDGKWRQIVRVDSPCPLRVETLPTNLILLVGCSPDETRTWYRIVRSDGKTLLRGNTSPNGWLAHADAPTGADVFAIGTAEASHPIDFTHGIVASDFQNFAVSVYRISDGHRLYEARAANGAVNRQSFALSDSGHRLAILSGEDVSLYRIDGPPITSETRNNP
jgi:hypothetical protein